MRFSVSPALLALLSGCALAVPATNQINARDINSITAKERAIALQGALNNIGPKGSKVPGAAAGIVVASPSKADPNCKLWRYGTTELMFMRVTRFLYVVQRLGSDYEDDNRRSNLR